MERAHASDAESFVPMADDDATLAASKAEHSNNLWVRNVEHRNNSCVRGCCTSDEIPLSVSKACVRILSPFARGAESIVYKASWGEKIVALKKPKLSTADHLDRFHKELQLLSKIRHPSIARLVAAHAYPPDYMYFFEFYEGGNLFHALHVVEWKPSVEQIMETFMQLGSALSYLHKQGIVHRDVKPANILLDSKQEAHLADFGLAAYLKDLEKPSRDNWKPMGKPTGGFYKKNMVGTLLYMAPEILNRELHSDKSDIYGLGITINEMFTGTVPYTDRKTEAQAHTILEMTYTEQQLVAAITSGLRPVLAGPEHGCPEDLAILIEKCWQGEASQRPSLDSILQIVNQMLQKSRSANKQELVGEPSQQLEVCQASEFSSFELGKATGKSPVLVNRGEGVGVVPGEKVRSVVSKWARDVGNDYCPILSWGVFTSRGGRETMEDTNFVLPNMGGTPYAHAFGVFDGHRGPEAAEFAACAIPNYLLDMQDSVSPMEALTTSFIEADSAFRSEVEAQLFKKNHGAMEWNPGCTAAIVLFANGRLFSANAGDCRVVLCRRGQALALSTDHIADSIEERNRVIGAGGNVSWQVDSWRVGSVGLQVTRSIGDSDLKPAVTAEPEVREVQLSVDDEFLVIASDGLWDTVSNQDAISLIKNTVKDAALCSKRLAIEAVERGSTDNITVMVLFLQPVSTLERVYYKA